MYNTMSFLTVQSNSVFHSRLIQGRQVGSLGMDNRGVRGHGPQTHFLLELIKQSCKSSPMVKWTTQRMQFITQIESEFKLQSCSFLQAESETNCKIKVQMFGHNYKAILFNVQGSFCSDIGQDTAHVTHGICGWKAERTWLSRRERMRASQADDRDLSEFHRNWQQHVEYTLWSTRQ